MPQFEFSSDDIAIIVNALRNLADSLTDAKYRAYVARYNTLALRLEAQSPSFTADDMRHFCIALKFHIEDSPLDWKASQLLSRLVPICGFVDVVT